MGNLVSIPGLGRSPGEGNGYPLQYSCLEISIDRGAWRAIQSMGVAKSQTRLTTNTFTSILITAVSDLSDVPLVQFSNTTYLKKSFFFFLMSFISESLLGPGEDAGRKSSSQKYRLSAKHCFQCPDLLKHFESNRWDLGIGKKENVELWTSRDTLLILQRIVRQRTCVPSTL